MKTIVAGGRKFNDLVYLTECLKKHNITEIVCGKARGADTLGEAYGTINNIPIKEFPASWKKYSYGAGSIRNKQMGDYAEALIAFWDGYSTGTLDMIRYAKKIGLKVTVYNYDRL